MYDKFLFSISSDNYEDDGPFHCQKCNVSFIARTTLSEHYDKHNVQTDLECKECGVHFTHHAVYNTHMMRHLSKYIQFLYDLIRIPTENKV